MIVYVDLRIAHLVHLLDGDIGVTLMSELQAPVDP